MMIDEIRSNLPPLHQKLAALALALLALFWIVRQVRYHRIREEHALLWFLGLITLLIVIWVDPLLSAITAVMGIEVPASAMILLVIFFLFIAAVWLTSVVSSQKQQIAQLFISVSLLKAKLAAYEAARRGEDDR